MQAGMQQEHSFAEPGRKRMGKRGGKPAAAAHEGYKEGSEVLRAAE